MIRLLLVDDEQIIREGIEAMIPFDRLGLSLTASCKNALEALDSMMDDMPDILLTDIRMPGMDGLMLIERAAQLNQSLQCVVLSGYDDFSYAQRAIKMGVKDYLLKPCTEEDITETLERLCAQIAERQMRSGSRLSANTLMTEEMAGKLALLIPEDKADKIAAWQVRALCESAEEDELVISAYIHLITKQEDHPERGFAEIQKICEAGKDYPDVIAQGLTRMAENRNQYRGFVRQICDYVQTCFEEEGLSLQYLADHVVHMRPDYIGREFFRDTGMKFSAYLLKVRMEKAKAMLLQGAEKQMVYEVAEKIGFGHNPQYFSQLFRKYTGMTPTEYSDNGKKQ